MLLQQLLENVTGTLCFGNPNLEITSLEYDSRRVTAGQVFFAIRGMKQDGTRFIPDALSRGAVAVVSETAPDSCCREAPAWVRVPDVRLAMALAANRFYDYPSRHIKLIGVTGTNGKTTVAYLLASILKTAGWKPALFGTIEYNLGCGQTGQEAPNTTPESLDLQRMLRQVVDNGGRAAVMEVSSHALALKRVAGCHFRAAVFTNFTRDHLDFHGDMESYFATKEKLFAPSSETPPPEFAVLNVDDTRNIILRNKTPARVITYGMEAPADVTAANCKMTPQGIAFTAQTPLGAIAICSPLLGRHNIYNLLASVACAQTLDVSPDNIHQGILPVRVAGRMEAVDGDQPFTVLVDYAHTDDALRRLVESAREWSGDGRILLVFGCGGERDRTKRPLMGMAAAEADKAFVTSDNPRGEDPLGIINDITVGLQKVRANYEVEPDRERAIELALQEARKGDTVLLAGKGHETYQIVGDRKLPFSDREVARTVLRRLGFGKESEAGSQKSE